MNLLCIIFDKVDRYIRKYDRTKYLRLFHSDEKNKEIFNRVRYSLMLKSNIFDDYPYKYMKIKNNSDEDLRLEKALNMHNVIILIKYVFNKNFYH